MEFKRIREEIEDLQESKRLNDLTESGELMLAELKQALQLLQTDVMQSVCGKELFQKLKFVLECKNEAQAERIIEQFIFHQEELTIEFADWLNNSRFSQYGNAWTNPRLPKDSEGDWVFFSSKELYDIFKRKRSETVA